MSRRTRLNGYSGQVDLAALTDPTGVGYDVIILAGQSNMSGRGTAYDLTRYDPVDPRIFQYGNAGTYANLISMAVEPLAMHDTPTGMGPGLVFARWYLHAIAPNRRVLLVPVAHGGTGFHTTSVASPPAGYSAGAGTWEVGGAGVNLFDNAVSQANAAITAGGSGSRIVAALWLQGETDGDIGVSGATYQSAFDALIDALRAQVTGAASMPVIIGQMVPEGIAAVSARQPINAVHIDTPRRKLLTGFAYGTSGNNNGDNLHYNAPGQRLMGRAMFDAWVMARANVLGIDPIPPTGVTLAQSGTSINVSWTRPICRITDYTVEYKLSASGSWTTLTRSQNLDYTATITGLTLGSTYNVRVSTVNERGTSVPSAAATLAMVTLPAQVTGLAAGTPTSSTVPLTWNAASGATSYLVEYKQSSSGTWLTGPTSTTTSATVTGLTDLTQYDFRCSAVNAAGTGTPSATVTATTAAAVTPLIDAVGVSAARAYSLRKARTAYAGSCIRVRRSSDNTEQDIGFTGSNLDTTSLLSFAGSGSAYIKTWYDQSGNGKDLTQTTTGAQARIVNAGTLDTINSKPVAVFDGAATVYSDTSPGLYAAGAATVLTVFKGTATNNVRFLAEASTSSNNQQYSMIVDTAISPFANVSAFMRNDANTVLLNDGGGATPAGFNGTLNQVSVVDSGSAIAPYVNATLTTSMSYTRSGTLTLNTFAIGALVRAATGTYFVGSLSEVVCWTSALSTGNRQTGEANQKSYFSTP